MGGKEEIISIGRLKSAHLDIDSPVQVDISPSRGCLPLQHQSIKTMPTHQHVVLEQFHQQQMHQSHFHHQHEVGHKWLSQQFILGLALTWCHLNALITSSDFLGGGSCVAVHIFSTFGDVKSGLFISCKLIL